MIDSLSTLLVATNDPSERITILVELVRETHDRGQNDYNKFYTQLVELAQENDDNFSLGFATSTFAYRLYSENKFSEAANKYQQASDLYKSANYINDSNIALAKVGAMYQQQGNNNKAGDIYDLILRNTMADSLKRSRSFVLAQKGGLYRDMTLLDSAEVNYTKALGLSTDLIDSLGMVTCWNNLAIIYAQTKQIDRSLKNFEYVTDYYRSHGNYYELSITLHNLSSFHLDLSQTAKALDYAKEAYYLATDINLKPIQAAALSQIGDIYRSTGEYESALHFLDEVMDMNNEDNFDTNLRCAEIRGDILKHKKDYDGAIITYKDALSVIAKKDIKTDRSAGLSIGLAEAYYTKGDLREAKSILSTVNINQKNSPHHYDLMNLLKSKISKDENKFDLAIKYGESAYKGLLEAKRLDYPYKLAGILSEAYEKKNNTIKALYYSRQNKILGDSLNNVDKVKALTKETKDFEFELERRDMAAAQEHKEAILKAETKQSRIIAGGTGVLALLSFFSFLNFRKKNKIITEQKNRLESLNSTKDQIFSIIGHDLKKPALAFRGITNKLNYLIDNNDRDRLIKFGESIETDAAELNKLTDNLLNWALLQKDLVSVDSTEISLQELVTENIALFQRIADEKKITLTSDLGISTVKSDKHILSTVIRNLMDNAIKYTPEGGAITIKAQELDNRISLSIQDSGVGMSEAQVNKLFTLDKSKSTKGTMGEGGTGLGMHLVEQLVEKIEGTINVDSVLGEGSTFEVALPLA